MNTTTAIAAGLLAVAALALTACGDSEDTSQGTPVTDASTTSESPTAQDGSTPVAPEDDPLFDQGAYGFMSEQSTEITFDLPTSPDHELLAEVEEFREAADAEPVTYVVADVDNRHGNQKANLQKITVYDDEGNDYEFTPLAPTVDGWQAYWDADGDYIAHDGTQVDEDTYNQLKDQASAIKDQLESSVDVSGRGEIALAYEGNDLPDKFTRVTADAHALGEQDVYPVK